MDARIWKIVLAAAVALVVTLAVPSTAAAQELVDDETLQRAIPVTLVTDEGGTTVGTTGVAVQGGDRRWYLGVRGGAYFDVDEAFAGVEVLAPLGSRVWFNPNFEWVFVEGADLATANADLHYDLATDGEYSFWIGAGLGMRYFKLDRPNADGNWDPGLNLLAGIGFGSGDFIPYIQGKLYVGDDNEFVLAGGFRF